MRHGQRRINSNVEQSDHSPAKVAQSATNTFILVPSLFNCTGNRRNKQAVVVMFSLLPEWPQITWQLPLLKVLEDSNRTELSTNRWKTLRQTLLANDGLLALLRIFWLLRSPSDPLFLFSWTTNRSRRTIVTCYAQLLLTDSMEIHSFRWVSYFWKMRHFTLPFKLDPQLRTIVSTSRERQE